jgi:probable rRNA maturation factor
MHSIKVANPYEQPLDFAALKAAATAVLEGEGIPAAKVGLAFVDNAHIHRLNKQFLNHDEPTDVLTFPYSTPKAKKLEGEVVIGYEVAAENAVDRGHAVDRELILYVIHGCLHLCGYDDTTAKAARTMREKERKYLTKLNLPDITDRSE